MKTRVIVNPRSGRLLRQAGELRDPRGESAIDLAAIEAALAALPGAELRLTERRGHAEELAREAAAQGYELVVAAGGDGNLNEVLNGIAPGGDEGGSPGRPGPRLGVLPLGTGNDFARSIDVPADLAAAVAVLARGRTAAIDVGRAAAAGTRRYFLNVAGGGFAGLVAERLDPEIKRAWGPLSYLRGAIEALQGLASYRTTVSLDGGETLALPVFSVLVANARYVASGVPVAPAARLDDGLLDLLVLPELSVAQLALLVPLMLLGRHHESDHVVFRRAARIEIRSTPPMWFDADGELLGEGPAAVFEVLPQALEVVVGGEDD